MELMIYGEYFHSGYGRWTTTTGKVRTKFSFATVKPANDTEEFYAAVARYAQTPHEAKMSTMFASEQDEILTNRPVS